MEFTIKVYEDPGHAWGAVKRKVLIELGVLDKISTYSYQKGDTVYLEEDCDLGVLIGALKAKGSTIVFKEKHTNNRSPIRGYETFKA
jgi:hypothetical protein